MNLFIARIYKVFIYTFLLIVSMRTCINMFFDVEKFFFVISIEVLIKKRFRKKSLAENGWSAKA